MSDILLGAIIGAGAVLAANILQLLGSWRSSKRADTNWRRDQRRDAYADLIQASDDFRKAAHDLHVTPVVQSSFPLGGQPPGFAARASAFEQQSHLLDRAASRVNLLGSRAVQQPVNALALHALLTMSNAAQAEPKTSDDEWQSITGQFLTLYDALLNAAREDLGFEALPPPAELGVTASL